ncbi:MAG: M15 family metallopeptidase [Glaciimonas sp.]|nr:M15 family metallopeptidase [Glaciimonas sp.]
MLFVVLVLYFVLACSVIWLVLFPSTREATLRLIGGVSAKIGDSLGRWKQSKDKTRSHALASLSALLFSLGHGLRRHYLLCIVVISLIALPPLVALMLSSKSMLEGFEDSGGGANLQVAELLKGEQLAPPPPLPPDFFTTQEVMQVRPMLANASRNWQLLNNDYAQRLLLIFKIMKEKHGYDMAIIEGYRSPERQNILANIGEHVTKAAAFQSFHQYGLAADCAFLRNGKLVISEKDSWAMEGYRLYGEVAESVGLTWGGRWKMMDFGHTELHLQGVIRK